MSRFISIMIIVALGTGFFAGMKATAPTMLGTAQDHFDRYALMDFQLLSMTGFSEEDADAVRELENVQDVVPSFSVDVMGKTEDQTSYKEIKVMALHEQQTINQVKLLEGRYPEAGNECIISRKSSGDKIYQLGETISLRETAGDLEVDTVLENMEYTVVGLIESPMYFSYSYGGTSIGDGSISAYMYIPAGQFQYARYTVMYVTMKKDAEQFPNYSEAYDQRRDELQTAIEELGIERQAIYLSSLQEELDDAQSELDEKTQEANDALEDAKVQLEEAEKELQDALDQLNAGQLELDTKSEEAQAQIAEQEKKLQDARAEIQKYKTKLKKSQKEYDAGKLELASSRKKLDKSWQEYYSGKQEYDSGASKLAASKAQLDDGYQTLSSSQKQYDDAMSQYDSLVTLRDQQKKLDEAKSILDAEKAQLDKDWATYKKDKKKFTYEELSARQAEYDSRLASYQSVVSSYQAALNNAGVSSVAELSSILAEQKEQLDAAKGMLQDGWNQYNQGLKEYKAGKKELDASKKKLDSAYQKLQKGEKEYKAGQKKLDSALAQLTSGQKEIKASEKKLADAEKQLKQAKKEAAEQIEEGRQELEEAQKEYDDGLTDYQKGLEEYEIKKGDTERELSDAAAEIQSALGDLTELSDEEWYVLSRDRALENYSSLGEDAKRLDAVAGVFPVFFLLVAILVCVTTMTRMVEEQRSQIGTYKAMGLPKPLIRAKYLLFSGAASVVGGIIGIAVCVQLFPRVIIAAYSSLYTLPNPTISLPWLMMAVSLLAGVGAAVGVTYFCCRRETEELASALMRPRPPKNGKGVWLERVPAIWNRLSFSLRLTVRNLSRSKIRDLMTLTGVLGCTALIVAGFGLNNSISPIVDLQYRELASYDGLLSLYDSCDEELSKVYFEELSENCGIDEGFAVKYRSVELADPSGEREVTNYCSVYVPSDLDTFEELVHLREGKRGPACSIRDGAIVVTQKLAAELNAGVGDELVLRTDDKEYTFTVSGIAENYAYHNVYMAPDTYEELFGEKPLYDTLIFVNGEKEFTTEELLGLEENFLTVTYIDDMYEKMDSSLSSMKMVVFVMIVSAMTLAAVVIYNLTNINIMERTRELAVLKVLGSHRHDVDMYVFRENIILTVLGMIVGCGAGYLLAQLMIRMVETDMVMFSRYIQPISYVYSCLLTGVASLIVMWMMSRKIRKIDMITSLKSIE